MATLSNQLLMFYSETRVVAVPNVISTALNRYSVAARDPEMPPAPASAEVKYDNTDFWEYTSGCGCVAAILAIPAAIDLIRPTSLAGYAAAAILGIAFPFLILAAIGAAISATKKASLQNRADEQRHEEWERDKQAARDKAEREARDTTARLRALLVKSAELRASLFIALQEADVALENAEGEFVSRVIPEFWDAVELAAAALARYDRDLHELLEAAKQYYSILQSRKHTFPPFPFVSSDLPAEEDVVGKFKLVVRQGQSDYQFATIWENRRTREVIRTGFGSLERAVRSVGANMVAALQDVQSTLDVGFDRAVDVLLSSRAATDRAANRVVSVVNAQRTELSDILRSQNSKLDNIQWRRKPLGSRYLRE